MSSAPSPAIAENPWLTERVVIDHVTSEIPGVATYHLRFSDPAVHAEYCFRPGQFNMLYLPGAGEIAISVSGGGADTTWDHTIRVAGNVTRTLAALGRGGSLGLRGPYGSGWPLAECDGADVILVAGGVGMAPLRGAAYAIGADRARFGKVTLLYGARNPDTLLYQREYDDWLARSISIQTTVDRGSLDWRGNVGVVPQLLDRVSPLAAANTVVLMCGPEVMMRYTVRSALARGIGKQQIWVSLERNMQCAVGLCGHCQLGPAFVCKDGPVFRYDVIEPFLSVEGL
jgi:NAD(P)H-flavin reductase